MEKIDDEKKSEFDLNFDLESADEDLTEDDEEESNSSEDEITSEEEIEDNYEYEEIIEGERDVRVLKDTYDAAIKKVRHVVKFFRKHPVRDSVLQRHCKYV